MRLAAKVALVVTGMALLANGKNVSAAQPILPSGYHVAACLQPAGHGATAIRAQYLASRIFAAIGLSLDWIKDHRSCLDDSAIRITLQDSAPPTQLPGALAYALPYEGSHIAVFYDRVRKAVEPPDVPTLLAHVLVHEITHILQGFNYHSESGMMKAHWTEADFQRMAQEPLPFTDGDIWLMRSGLEGAATKHGFINLGSKGDDR